MLSKLNTTALLRANVLKSSIAAVQTRDFGAKRKKKVKSDPDAQTEYETVEETVEETVDVEETVQTTEPKIGTASPVKNKDI